VGLLRFATGPQGHDLLTVDPTDKTEHAVVEPLKIVRAAQIAARAHRPFVPLSARPVPYQIRGSNEGPYGPPAPPLPQPAPPPPKLTIEEGLRQPYTIRGDSGGRSRGAIADMNTGAQITANLMRGD
jgi:hypothetical protein